MGHDVVPDHVADVGMPHLIEELGRYGMGICQWLRRAFRIFFRETSGHVQTSLEIVKQSRKRFRTVRCWAEPLDQSSDRGVDALKEVPLVPVGIEGIGENR